MAIIDGRFMNCLQDWCYLSASYPAPSTKREGLHLLYEGVILAVAEAERDILRRMLRPRLEFEHKEVGQCKGIYTQIRRRGGVETNIFC